MERSLCIGIDKWSEHNKLSRALAMKLMARYILARGITLEQITEELLARGVELPKRDKKEMP
jgi:hypothetical protein